MKEEIETNKKRTDGYNRTLNLKKNKFKWQWQKDNEFKENRPHITAYLLYRVI